MCPSRLHLISPVELSDFVGEKPLNEALLSIAGLAGADFSFGTSGGEGADGAELLPNGRALPIEYDNRPVGKVLYPPAENGSAIQRAAAAISSVVKHALARELAVEDLAQELNSNYQELNVLYSLLPSIATKTQEAEIGRVLIDQAAEVLQCRRVSLMVFDERQENLRVLAARGIPAEACGVCIPVAGTVSERVLQEEMLVVNDILQHPELAGRSRGQYDGSAFVVARVPLRAQGQPVGILAATERIGGAEFTAHDCKLLEGLSAMGASAILNCRLHSIINKQMMNTIQALACAVDAKDQYTHDHAGRVAELCTATYRMLGLGDNKEYREVELSGLLHDVGKIGIPDVILCKPGKLTAEEFNVMKTHTRTGAGIVGKVEGLGPVAEAILHHHERYDGLGYPDQLSQDSIPLASRLIAVTDTFDALTSDRPYRKAVGTEKALHELHRCARTQFDPRVVEAFAAVIEMESQCSGGKTA